MYDFKKSLKNDAFYRIAIVYILIAIGIEIFILVKNPVLVYYIWPLVAILFCVVFIGFRYLMFKKFMTDVVFEKATILKTSYYRGSKVVKFEYSHKGEMFRKYVLMNYNQGTKHIEKNAVVDIALHPTHPKQALIYDLYYSQVNNERPE